MTRKAAHDFVLGKEPCLNLQLKKKERTKRGKIGLLHNYFFCGDGVNEGGVVFNQKHGEVTLQN